MKNMRKHEHKHDKGWGQIAPPPFFTFDEECSLSKNLLTYTPARSILGTQFINMT